MSSRTPEEPYQMMYPPLPWSPPVEQENLLLPNSGYEDMSPVQLRDQPVEDNSPVAYFGHNIQGNTAN